MANNRTVRLALYRWARQGLVPVCLALALVVFILPSQEAAGIEGNDAKSWTMLWRLFLPAVCALSALATNVAAARVDRGIDRLLKDEFPANHDLVRLTGQAIAMIVVAVSRDPRFKRERRELKRIARGVPGAWNTILLDSSRKTKAAFRGLADRALPEFIANPRRRALSRSLWLRLLQDASGNAPPRLEDVTLEHLIRQLGTRFGEALREALKDDFVFDRRAFAAFQLLFMQQMLRRTSLSSKRGSLGPHLGDPADADMADDPEDAAAVSAFRNAIVTRVKDCVSELRSSSEGDAVALQGVAEEVLSVANSMA